MKLRGVAVVVVGVALLGCGDDDDGGGGGGDGGGGADSSIVGPGVPRYQEMNEVGNGVKAGAEATGFTVDGAGFVLEGQFEVGMATTDQYRFNTGSFGGATQPDFPGIDAFVYVGSERFGTGQTEVRLTLDAIANDGFSTLSLGGFSNAAVTRGVDYALGVSTGAARLLGKSYRIEVRGHTP